MNDTNQPQDAGDGSADSARQRKTAVYYGPAPYSGLSPAAYGGRSAGGSGAPYGTAYGAPYGYGHDGAPGGAGAEDGDALLGTVTIGRVLRVCSQRWITLVVATVLGGVAAYVLFRSMPSIYESTSVFEMNIRRPRILKTESAYVEESQNDQADEVFNTRLAKLRSWDVVQEVIRRFRADHPSSTSADEELLNTLANNTDLALQRRSRLVRITVRSASPDMAAWLANAYALTVDASALDENRTQSDKAVAWLKGTMETQRRLVLRAEQAILDFRVANKMDSMANEQTAITAAVQKFNADAVDLAIQVYRAQDLVKALEALQDDPAKFGALPDQAPLATELREVFQKLAIAQTERNVLLSQFTSKHPDLTAKEKEVEMLRQQFADQVGRCRETARANLDLLSKQLEDSTKRCNELNARSAELELSIVNAKTRLDELTRERDAADLSFRGIQQREQEARLSTDENTATIKIVERAVPNKDPVSPNPLIIMPSGPLVGLLLGVIFVLLLDHLEDRVTGIADVELRLRMKVLAVLPHIRRARREQLALLCAENRFSHFAEVFAGLRMLLHSHGYAGFSKVVLIVSTQPGEGKTSASSNLALSCAQSGERTVLIDCDLRRPRIARVYGKGRKDFESMLHGLRKDDPEVFGRLPVPSGEPNLDLVCSRPSADINPANLLSANVMAQFIDWARQHYDRVIIDSAPFGLVSDAVALSTLADGIILMCCPGRTRFRPLAHAIRHLSEVGGHLLGVLVNDVDISGCSGMFSRYDYEHHYSESYKGVEGLRPDASASNAALAAGQTVTPGGAPTGRADDEEED